MLDYMHSHSLQFDSRANRTRRSTTAFYNNALSPEVASVEPAGRLKGEAAAVSDDPLDSIQRAFSTVAQTLEHLRDKRILPRKTTDEFFHRFMQLRQALESGVADPEAWMEQFETTCDDLTQAAEEAQAMRALDEVLFDATAELQNNNELLRQKFYQLTGQLA